MRILILGGTAEARELAATLVDAGHEVTSSLAGRVRDPRLPVGIVRIGGFGGLDGLHTWLTAHRVEAVVDATHPYAEQMSSHAVQACSRALVPLVRLERPGWAQHPLASEWTWVDNHDQARAAADRVGRYPFLTTGRQTLEHYLRPWHDRQVLVRIVEPLDEPAPPSWRVIRDRGPYEVGAQTALLREHGVDVLLTKDSGGRYTSAKLEAAAELGVPVVVLRRPAIPREVTAVTSTAAAVAAIVTLSSSATA